MPKLCPMHLTHIAPIYTGSKRMCRANRPALHWIVIRTSERFPENRLDYIATQHDPANNCGLIVRLVPVALNAPSKALESGGFSKQISKSVGVRQHCHAPGRLIILQKDGCAVGMTRAAFRSQRCTTETGPNPVGCRASVVGPTAALWISPQRTVSLGIKSTSRQICNGPVQYALTTTRYSRSGFRNCITTGRFVDLPTLFSFLT